MINILRKISIKQILIIIMLVFTISLAGCSGGEIVEEDKYIVVYDGNGGYLGNKTYTYRKLEVSENSIIPKYLSEYAKDDPYVVSSLGLATRQGFTLMGWYLEENAQYAPNPTGTFVYLDLEDGNGVYNINDEGDYVYGYILDENGPLIFINVEPIGENDPETTEYIFYNGGNGLGFYIYNSEDADHVEVYDVDGGYSPSELTGYVGYLIFDDLTEAEKTLFAGIPRYRQAFYEYTEADEGLLRYNLESGYVNYESLYELSVEGEYVNDQGVYVLYDSENPEHNDLERYRIAPRYVFTSTAEVDVPAKLARYNAEITYWDFESDRVNEDMTLLAHWERKLTVNYIQMSGQITSITTKQNETNTGQVNLVAGEVIGKLETIPIYPEYTFVGWSTSETEYLPWDFETDVFPLGITELNLYAYMIEGSYTRITSASGLAKVVNNPSGNYLLVNDIDLNGASYNNSTPLGFQIKTAADAAIVPFTGEFITMGNTISNFTINVSNLRKLVDADAGVVIIGALFPHVQDARISGVRLENVSAVISTSSTATSVVSDIGAAGLIGIALEGETTVDNVYVDLTITQSSPSTITYPVYIGDIVAYGAEYVTITNSTSDFEYTAIMSITSNTLNIETLD
ncbi:MAG: InlB B-repeat-containing protein [Candidatus Izemoplasmatales bacterium]